MQSNATVTKWLPLQQHSGHSAKYSRQFAGQQQPSRPQASTSQQGRTATGSLAQPEGQCGKARCHFFRNPEQQTDNQPDTPRDLGRFNGSAAATLMSPSRTGSRQRPGPQAAPWRVRGGGSGRGRIPPVPAAATAGEPILFSVPRWKRYSQVLLPAPRRHLGKRGQYEALPPKAGRQGGSRSPSSIVPPSSPHGAGPQTRN